MRNEKLKSLYKDGKQLLMLMAVIFLLLKVFFVLIFVPTGSMKPTIKEKSFLIAWRLSYLLTDPIPERGDIIVFNHEEYTERLVKRVIGIPGDDITVLDGAVFINGEKYDEPYLAEMDLGLHDGQFKVPEGKLFVMGDNRNYSTDSRCWNNPFVDVESVYAKVILRLNMI